MEQIRVVELFAGVGGFRLGLEQLPPAFRLSGRISGNHPCVPNLLSSATNGFRASSRTRLSGHRGRLRKHPSTRPFGRWLSLSGLLHRQKGRTRDRREEGRSLVGDQRYPTAHSLAMSFENVDRSSNLRPGKKGVIFPSSCGASMKQAMPLNGG